MLNIKLWLFIAILVAAVGIGMLLGYGKRKGKCILCRVFDTNDDIIDKAEKEDKLSQDDANILVSNLVKLGKVLQSGTFEVGEGNESEVSRINETLAKYKYAADYAKIIAVPV